MTALTLLMVAAAVGYGISTALKIPAIPLLVAAGLATSLFGLQGDPDLVRNILILGVTFLVFVAGTELNPRRLGRQWPLAVQIGLAQFLLMGGLGFGVANLLGVNLLEAAYVGLALSASSTIIVVRLLQRNAQFFEPFGRLVLGVLLLQDLLVIVGIVALTNSTEGLAAVESGIFRSVVLFFLAWLCVRFVTPLLFVKLGLDEEGLLLSVLAILFSFLGLAWLMDLPIVVGALLAGFSVSFFPINGVVRGQLNSLSDFFSAIFFTALGASLTLPDRADLILALLFTALVLVITPILVAWLAERAGLTARSAIEGGVLLAQTSEFSLIVALLGVSSGHISQGTLSVIALVTVTTMTITPFIATPSMVRLLVRLQPSFRSNGRLPDIELQDHIVMLGCGTNTMNLLHRLQNRGHKVVVVDDDPAVIEGLRTENVIAFRGDGTDEKVLKSAGYADARAVISTLRRVHDNCHVARTCAKVPFYVRVYEDETADTLRQFGAIPVNYSKAAADEFIEWFDQSSSLRNS